MNLAASNPSNLLAGACNLVPRLGPRCQSNSNTATHKTAARASRLIRSRLFQIAVVALLGVLVIGASVFGYFYYHYQHVVDDRLASGPIFASVSQIYAAPREVRSGQKLTAASIAAIFARPATTAIHSSAPIQLNGDNIFIKPGPESYHTTDGATINTSRRRRAEHHRRKRRRAQRL